MQGIYIRDYPTEEFPNDILELFIEIFSVDELYTIGEAIKFFDDLDLLATSQGKEAVDLGRDTIRILTKR